MSTTPQKDRSENNSETERDVDQNNDISHTEPELNTADSANTENDNECKFVLPAVEMNQSEVMAIENLFENVHGNNVDSDSSSDSEEEYTNDKTVGNSTQNEHEIRKEKGNTGQSVNNPSTSHSIPTALKNATLTFNDDGKIQITEKIEDGLEMTYTWGEKLLPQTPKGSELQIKSNDLLSGNKPFQENVIKFHHIGHQFQLFIQTYS